MAYQTVDTSKVLANPALCGVVKNVVRIFSEKGYYSLGQFLQDLTNSDLSTLLGFSEKLESLDHESIVNLLVLSEVLALAEGTPAIEDAEAKTNFEYLCAIISMESLKRKGLIELNYSNISFGEDLASAPVASLTSR